MKKICDYRGYIIAEENGEYVIYKGSFLTKRLGCKNLTCAKHKIDRIIALHDN